MLKRGWTTCWIALLLWLGLPDSGFSQDTIFLFGDTIRVGELEWDMEKDWRARGVLLSENKDLYGPKVRIFLGYYGNKNTEQIVFGYLDSLQNFIAHGPARYFYPSGHLLGKRYHEEGVRHGKAEDFYKNGQVKMRSYFHNDTLHGAYTAYYENGVKSLACQYERGQPHGTYRAWYANQQRKWTEQYEHGVKTGPDSSFYETGKLESVFHFQENETNGEAIFYHRNGNPWTKRIYEMGKLVDVTYMKNKTGRPLEIGTFSEGNGWLNIYNDDGILVTKEKYRHGKLRRSKEMKK